MLRPRRSEFWGFRRDGGDGSAAQRGRLLIKRAYGDWGRFHRYRRAMLENGVDLFQLYSVGIQQKNRADVRLAIEAMETVFTRPTSTSMRSSPATATSRN